MTTSEFRLSVRFADYLITAFIKGQWLFPQRQTSFGPYFLPYEKSHLSLISNTHGILI